MCKLFGRLFPGKKESRGLVNDKTVPMARNPNPKHLDSPKATRYLIASCQSPGKERFHNEDAIFTFSSEMFGADSPEYLGVFLVADGMGGHQNGEVASRLAAEAASRELLDQLFDPLVYKRSAKKDPVILELLEQAVSQSQALIHSRVPGGGTTLTLALVVDDRFFSAHVGDSRMYIVNQAGQMSLKTKDHSLVKRLVDLGEITPQEASTHPQRNVLYRALGQEDPLEPDLDQFSLDVGEQLMICSDGLWGVLEDSRMETILKMGHPLEQTTCELVDAANEAGGPDNISVILVKRVS